MNILGIFGKKKKKTRKKPKKTVKRKKTTTKRKTKKKVPAKKSSKKTHKPKKLKKTIALKLKNIKMSNKVLFKEDTLTYVIEFFSKNKLTAAPVLDEKKIVGIMTSEILTNIINKSGISELKKAKQKKISRFMKRKIIKIQSSKTVSDAILKMNKNKVDNLIVYTKTKFTGIINRDEILEKIAAILRKPRNTPSKEIETDIDDFYFKIMEKQKATANHLSRVLSTDLDVIEEWGKALTSHNLIETIYSPFGKISYKIKKRSKK